MSEARYPPLRELVPHDDPMLLLDALVDYAPGEATCRLVIREGAAFVEDGVVDCVVAIEYMAQAVAACLGYEARQGGGGVRVGMIIASRRFDIAVPRLYVGEVFDVRIVRTRGDDVLSHCEARVERAGGGEVVASAQLTIFHAERPPEDEGAPPPVNAAGR